jgi:hypothetical protein
MSDAISETVIEAPQRSFLDRAGLRGFPWVPAIVLYTISYGWFWNVRNSYWSDDSLLRRFKSDGFVDQGFAPWVNFSQDVLFKLFGPISFRVLTFLLFFLSSVFVFGVSKKVKLLKEKDQKFFVLLFLLLPFNTTRVTLMTFHYTTAYVLFFATWYLLVTFKSYWLNILSFVLCFLSFQMHSLLVFFALPFLHIFWLEVFEKKINLTKFLMKFGALGSLPIIYWFARGFFWPERVPYHEISGDGLKRACSLGIVFVVFSVTVLFVARCSNENYKKSLMLVGLGAISVYLASVPYVIGGFVAGLPNFFTDYLTNFLGRSDHYSRHQTLQPLGVALILTGFFNLLKPGPFYSQKRFWILIFSPVLFFNLCFGFEYVVDNTKQDLVIKTLRNEREKDITNYMFADSTQNLNARGRTVRDRDWVAAIVTAYGLDAAERAEILTSCDGGENGRFVEINGPDTHWQALKNWVSDGDMGFVVTIDDSTGACKPELMQIARVSGVIPILFYFTGAKN